MPAGRIFLIVPLITMSSSITKAALRIVVALVTSIVWTGLIPVFGMPFGGCDAYGCTTFELGCSAWPEFIRGFGFVLIWLVIAPSRKWLYVLALILLAVLSVFHEIKMNGFTLLQSADGILLAVSQGLPILLGGLTAFGMYVAVRQIAGKYLQNNQSNDR